MAQRQMAKTQALSKPKGNSSKRAIVARGKHEDAILNKTRWDSEIKIRALADDLLKEYDESGDIWLQDFFTKRLITRKQISNMRNRSEYFKEIYSLVKDIQESRLFHAGITATGNPTFAIFSLKNVALWRNEPEIAEEPQDVVIRFMPAGGTMPDEEANESYN